MAVRIERRVDVDQIDARVGQLSKLLEIVPAINDTSIDDRGRFWLSFRHRSEHRSAATSVNDPLFLVVS